MQYQTLSQAQDENQEKSPEMSAILGEVDERKKNRL